jgi:hypothetical protein
MEAWSSIPKVSCIRVLARSDIGETLVEKAA